MPLLEELYWCNDFKTESDSRTITLHSLRTLIVEKYEYYYPEDYPELPTRTLPMVCTPKLTDLSITREIQDFLQISSVVRCSGCVIKRLEVHEVSKNFSLQVVRTLCDVEELILFIEMGDKNEGEEIVQNLIWNPTAGGSETMQILPSLRKIELHIPPVPTSNSVISLIDVMRSRSSSASESASTKYPTACVTPLSHVKVTWPLFYGNNNSAIFQLGEELGINVTAEATQKFGVIRSTW
ncbi:hypothetical protein BDQ17DRAFT_1333079 [Cyathus striatus]|nr:hypothetical protein BDQ17DRAFT_1333079 [Cyathus striatus]